MLRFILLPIFVLGVIFSLPNASFSYDVQDGTCFGYNNELCTLAKRESELGNMFRFSTGSYTPLGISSDTSTDADKISSYGLGLSLFTYQFNVNAYFSSIYELGGDFIFHTKPKFDIEAADGYFSLGIRVYPWRQWFFMGTGISLRGAYFIDSSMAKGGLVDHVTAQLNTYLELGFTFPSKGVNLDIGIQLKNDLLHSFGYNKFYSADDAIGNTPFTFFIGYRGLFGNIGAVPADEAYDALQFIKNQDTFMTFSNVYFNSEETVLSNSTKVQLINIIRLAKNYEPKMIIVRAFGDIQEKNIRKQQKIANQRAQAIFEYLISQGVSKDKILAIGIPTRRTTTQMLKERNQHAEIVLVR